MKRDLIIMEAFTNEILSWQKDEISQKRIAKINESIEILRATPKIPRTEKVKGLRKYKNIFRYKFYAYGAYYRLFYIYNKLNIAILVMGQLLGTKLSVIASERSERSNLRRDCFVSRFTPSSQ